MMKTMIIKGLNERGYKAEITTITKNGIVMTGVIIGDGVIRPTIYIDKYLNTGNSLSEIVSDIINTYENTPKPDINIKNVMSWDYAKNNLRLCLQKKTDEDIIKRDFLDMEMYVRVRVSANGTYKIKPGMFKEISEEEIFARAILNAKANVEIEDMGQMMADMMGIPVSELDTAPNMIVVSNKEKINGASAICDTELLSRIANTYKSDLVIIPSSIHDCILYPDNTPNIKYYNNMIVEVNETSVAPEERLSNHAYIFKRETCEIVW